MILNARIYFFQRFAQFESNIFIRSLRNRAEYAFESKYGISPDFSSIFTVKTAQLNLFNSYCEQIKSLTVPCIFPELNKGCRLLKKRRKQLQKMVRRNIHDSALAENHVAARKYYLKAIELAKKCHHEKVLS